jgi:hypothetical protein
MNTTHNTQSNQPNKDIKQGQAGKRQIDTDVRASEQGDRPQFEKNKFAGDAMWSGKPDDVQKTSGVDRKESLDRQYDYKAQPPDSQVQKGSVGKLKS